jgi:hypothetical protein
MLGSLPVDLLEEFEKGKPHHMGTDITPLSSFSLKEFFAEMSG